MTWKRIGDFVAGIDFTGWPSDFIIDEVHELTLEPGELSPPVILLLDPIPTQLIITFFTLVRVIKMD